MSNHYQDALKLEVSLLEALLRRNICAHRRSKYYQRTSMVLRAILKSGAMGLIECVQTWKEQRRNNNKKQAVSNGNSSDLMWDKDSLQRDLNGNNNNNKDILTSYQRLCRIRAMVTDHIPTILSRIAHASQPLFLELHRGFFVPFCTVAVAALARIRVLLMRMGHYVLDVLLEQQVAAAVNTTKKELQLIRTMDMTLLRNQFTEPQQLQKKQEQPKQQQQQQQKQPKTNHHPDKQGKKAEGNMMVIDRQQQQQSSKWDKTISSEEKNVNDVDGDTSGNDDQPQPRQQTPTEDEDDNPKGTIIGHDTIAFANSNQDDDDDDDVGQAVLVLQDDPEESLKGSSSHGFFGGTIDPSSIKVPSKKRKRKRQESLVSMARTETETETEPPADATPSLETKKKKTKKRKRSIEPSTTTAKDLSLSKTSKKDKQKKAKKKKEKKKDFFDELFD